MCCGMDVRPVLNLYGVIRRLDEPPELAFNIVFCDFNPAVVRASPRLGAICRIRSRLSREMSFEPHPFKVRSTSLETR